MWRLSLRRKRALDRRKTALEFLVGLPQEGLRIGVQMASEIDRGEQQIADFGRRARFIFGDLRFDLVGLFADFAQDGTRIVPVETDPACLVLGASARG